MACLGRDPMCFGRLSARMGFVGRETSFWAARVAGGRWGLWLVLELLA